MKRLMYRLTEEKREAQWKDASDYDKFNHDHVMEIIKDKELIIVDHNAEDD